jgi:hypothetical protein
MTISQCPHTHTATGVFDTDLSRTKGETCLYTAQIAATICADCGRIIDLYCKSPAAVCAWLEKRAGCPRPDAH